MIVVVGCTKGGTGKTTLSTNLTVLRAAEGKKVLLVDADEQKSASIWANQRDSSGLTSSFTTIQLGGKAVYSQISKMKPDYDDIIIDVGGRETRSLRAAIVVADVLVLPFRPGSYDIWTITEIKGLLSEMIPANPNLQCIGVINQADPSGKENEEALEILKQCEEIETYPMLVGYRKAFRFSATDGLGVGEMEVKDPKAIMEMQALYDFIYNKCTCNVSS